MSQQLIPIAYAEDRDAQIKHSRIVMRRSFSVYAVWTACKNDALVPDCLDLFGRDPAAGLDFGIHMLRAHATGYQLVVLSAKVKNQHLIHRVSPFPYRLMSADLPSA